MSSVKYEAKSIYDEARQVIRITIPPRESWIEHRLIRCFDILSSCAKELIFSIQNLLIVRTCYSRNHISSYNYLTMILSYSIPTIHWKFYPRSKNTSRTQNKHVLAGYIYFLISSHPLMVAFNFPMVLLSSLGLQTRITF